MNEKKKLQPKVRFREFTGENAPDWEQRKLGEVAKRYNGVINIIRLGVSLALFFCLRLGTAKVRGSSKYYYGTITQF